MSIAVIKPQDLAELCKNGQKIDLIDVRTPVEFREIHVEFARNVPLDQLDAAKVMQARNGSASEPLYVICRSGSRGRQACELFSKAGFSNVFNIEGGTMACVEVGLPVVRGKTAISLERQVRIAAGSLVLLGAALGWFVHPAFIGLSAFVGAGLVFAGITDTCGMGMLLARMPWNQVSGNANSTGTACRVGALLLAAAVLAPAATFAVEHTQDSLVTVQRGVAEKKAVLVDVREKKEWEDGHLRDARLLPLSTLERGVGKEDLARVIPQDKVIYLHCALGGRCLQAAAILKKQGYDVRPLKLGFDALLDAGFPGAKR